MRIGIRRSLRTVSWAGVLPLILAACSGTGGRRGSSADGTGGHDLPIALGQDDGSGLRDLPAGQDPGAAVGDSGVDPKAGAGDPGSKADPGGATADPGGALDPGGIDPGSAPASGAVGAPCASADQCEGGTCLNLPGGYCSVAGCKAAACPAGSRCFDFEGGESYCLDTCATDADCNTGAGYECDGDKVCWPKDPGGGQGNSPVGGTCKTNADCKDTGAQCYPEMLQGAPTGFVKGYCLIPDCTASSCPQGSRCEKIFADGGSACVKSCAKTGDCDAGYSCFQPGMCFPGCAQSACPANYGCDAEKNSCIPACTPGSCGGGLVCGPNGVCGDPPCTPGSCPSGQKCAQNGTCVADVSGGPGAGPGPACASLPVRDCSGGAGTCGQLLPFVPVEGPGYVNYPLNGETWENQYRSFARRDMRMLIKWASAYVDCKGKAWEGGNGKPVGLGDMSESDGAIPGTSDGKPGHPEGTHVGGSDMDIAYFQVGTPNNYLRPVCPHTTNYQEQNHCVGPPDKLDLWRTALFIGALMTSEQVRVIGVDGKVGPLVTEAASVLCADGWLPAQACQKMASALAFEVTDQGLGWFQFHHHHLHVSLWGLQPRSGGAASARCLTPDCAPVEPQHFTRILPWLPLHLRSLPKL